MKRGITFYMEKDLWEAFGEVCKKFGMSRSEVLEAFIEAMVRTKDNLKFEGNTINTNISLTINLLDFLPILNFSEIIHLLLRTYIFIPGII